MKKIPSLEHKNRFGIYRKDVPLSNASTGLIVSVRMRADKITKGAQPNALDSYNPSGAGETFRGRFASWFGNRTGGETVSPIIRVA
jgi:hypothetical protein